MAKRKASGKKKASPVEVTVAVDPDQLKLARQVLRLRSDEAVLRFALEHLVGHFEHHPHKEE